MTSMELLDAVAERLAAEPDIVLPTLRLIVDVEALPDDPGSMVGEAKLLSTRRIAERQRAVREGSYTTNEVRQILGGISRQAVSQRTATGSLLAADLAGRKYFPGWQFSDTGTVAGLQLVTDACADAGIDAIAADTIMRTPLPEEDGSTPADLLRSGAAALAAHYLLALARGF